MTLHLVPLRSISFSEHQLSNLASETVPMARKILQSSANSNNLDPRKIVSMSLTNTEHRRGPRWEPCGTPDVTEIGFEIKKNYILHIASVLTNSWITIPLIHYITQCLRAYKLISVLTPYQTPC
jgi:hypothetical protein